MARLSLSVIFLFFEVRTPESRRHICSLFKVRENFYNYRGALVFYIIIEQC